MPGRRPSSVEMRTPAVLSAGVHVAAMVAAIMNFNFFSRPMIEPEPVMLDFVAIDKHAAAPTIGNPPPQPKDAKIAAETTKAPPPKTFEPPPAPEPPKPDVAEFKPFGPPPGPGPPKAGCRRIKAGRAGARGEAQARAAEAHGRRDRDEAQGAGASQGGEEARAAKARAAQA